jgi:hypothetical protein
MDDDGVTAGVSHKSGRVVSIERGICFPIQGVAVKAPQPLAQRDPAITQVAVPKIRDGMVTNVLDLPRGIAAAATADYGKEELVREQPTDFMNNFGHASKTFGRYSGPIH